MFSVQGVCSGYAVVKGSHRADRLTGKATIASGMRVGTSEVLRSLRHYMPVHIQRHHRSPGDKRRRKRSAWGPSLKKTRKVIVSQANAKTVLKAKLVKRGWAHNYIRFSERIYAILNSADIQSETCGSTFVKKYIYIYYVPCIYSYSRWYLPSKTNVFVLWSCDVLGARIISLIS